MLHVYNKQDVLFQNILNKIRTVKYVGSITPKKLKGGALLNSRFSI